MRFLGRIHQALIFRRRVRVLGKILSELLPTGARVLDVGCGDGSVAAEILRRRVDLTFWGLEVALRPEASIPVALFDGTRIPVDDGGADAVLLVDVLHHAADPEELLEEALRVAGTAVVVKDHLRDGFVAAPTLRFMDWVGNAPHGVELSYDYWTGDQWRAVFRRLGVRASEWRGRLELYPWPLDLVFGRSLHFAARLEHES